MNDASGAEGRRRLVADAGSCGLDGVAAPDTRNQRWLLGIRRARGLHVHAGRASARTGKSRHHGRKCQARAHRQRRLPPGDAAQRIEPRGRPRSQGLPPHSDFLLHNMGALGNDLEMGKRARPRNAHRPALGPAFRLSPTPSTPPRQHITRRAGLGLSGRSTKSSFWLDPHCAGNALALLAGPCGSAMVLSDGGSPFGINLRRSVQLDLRPVTPVTASSGRSDIGYDGK
jgi:hypothetical protein